MSRHPALRLLLLALPAALVPAMLFGYSDGPPPAHTGGFGEATCAACHFPPEEPAEGALRIEGVPETPRPGERYRLTVTLEDPGLERGGFELSARTAAGEQAGRLEAVDERVEVVTGGDGDVQYARHTLEGARPAGAEGEESTGRAAWRLLWIAPDLGEGAASKGAVGRRAEVLFHAAGNAGDYDASEFGDVPYTAEASTRATVAADVPPGAPPS